MDALGIVEDEVRDQVRRRGLDPTVDRFDLKELVETAVSEYDRRSMVSALPLIGEVDRAVKRIMDSVAGFGELQPMLDDDEVEEIWINGPGKASKVVFDWGVPVTDCDFEPSRDLLLSAAEQVELLLEIQPDLSGHEVERQLRDKAQQAPVVCTTLHHLGVDGKSPYAFCSRFLGPDRQAWYELHGPDDLMERFTAGSTCCPLCVLALG
ncbi:Flp pilus assembly protein, ATPase CpaF [Nesterenkonia sp. F]|uniref:Flp pilus assembly protein, ATPase CpaF n=1 Tax=Nesterenkonia sp. F TaxID=795955 RepID=UPI000255CB3E|nr:Flp pilus assembly protein, ATPase CpaF [Nesterenkonia sp. F]